MPATRKCSSRSRETRHGSLFLVVGGRIGAASTVVLTRLRLPRGTAGSTAEAVIRS